MKFINTSGKRKKSIAHATLKPGTGVVRMNGQLIDNIHPDIGRLKIREPLILSDHVYEKVNIDIQVQGGGAVSRCDAARLALARALVKFDKKLEKTFIAYDRHLLVADIRRKEVRKPNDSRARAARQKSYR